MLKKKSLATVCFSGLGILASSMLLVACQPASDKKTEVKADQASASEVVVEKLSLKGSTQNVPVHLTDCDGNSCPEISIDRLSTNQFVLDSLIDHAILKQLNQILETTGTTDKSKNEKVLTADEQRAASELAATKTPVQLMTDQVQPYVNSFLALDKELKNLGVSHQISLSVSPKILNSEEPLATVVLNTSSYLGGAHGSSSQHYLNFDLKQQKQVELSQLVLPNQQAKLDHWAYEAFKKWVVDSKLADNVEEYEQAWKFNLSSNYYLGKQGLILQYQEYEIGPYVVGLPRLVLPYDELHGILKPEYLPESARNQAATSEAVTSIATESKPKS